MNHEEKRAGVLSYLPILLGLLCFTWIAIDRLHDNFTAMSLILFIAAVVSGLLFYWAFMAAFASVITKKTSAGGGNQFRFLNSIAIVSGAIIGAGVFFGVLFLFGL